LRGSGAAREGRVGKDREETERGESVEG